MRVVAMAYGNRTRRHAAKMSIDIPDGQPLWQLDFAEVTGHNLEARGRKEVNRLLQTGWRLLHIYTLTYKESGVWRERPMAILGRPRNVAATLENGVLELTLPKVPKAQPVRIRPKGA